MSGNLINLGRRIGREVLERVRGTEKSSEYWTSHNVTLHRSFKTAQESLAYFDRRNDQYLNYIDMMPVESRKFLCQIQLDKSGLPLVNGQYAGIGGCYRLTPMN